MLQGSDIACCSVVKLVVRSIAEGAHAFLGKAISLHRVWRLTLPADKSRMGPWEPNHANSSSKPRTMASPKIETAGNITTSEHKSKAVVSFYM